MTLSFRCKYQLYNFIISTYMFTYASILVMLAMLNQSEVEVVAQEPKFNRADSSSDTRRCGWNWSSGVFLLLCYTWHDHTWKKTPTMLDNVIFIFIRIKMIKTCVSANFPHELRGRASRDWIRTSAEWDWIWPFPVQQCLCHPKIWGYMLFQWAMVMVMIMIMIIIMMTMIIYHIIYTSLWCLYIVMVVYGAHE